LLPQRRISRRTTGVVDMRIFTVLAGALALSACSGMGSSNMSGANTAAYSQKAVQVSTAVAKYRAAAATMASPADCKAAVDQYQSDVRPPLDAMSQMAGGMDDAMDAMGQKMHGDMQCGDAVMQDELNRHLGAACTFSDVAVNQAEVTRHCDAMQSYADHMQMRADEASSMMGSMMGGGMMGGTPTSTTGGTTTLPDGSTMSWNHTIPGCTYGDGGFQPQGGSTSGGADGGTTGSADGGTSQPAK
jgi:hypothetical protein